MLAWQPPLSLWWRFLVSTFMYQEWTFKNFNNFHTFIIVSSGVGEITFKWVVNANINLFLFCFLTTGIDVEKFDSWFLWCYFETLFCVLYQRRIDSLVLKWVCWEFELFAEFNLFKRTLLLFNDENEAWLKCSRVSWKVMFFSHGN